LFAHHLPHQPGADPGKIVLRQPKGPAAARRQESESLLQEPLAAEMPTFFQGAEAPKCEEQTHFHTHGCCPSCDDEAGQYLVQVPADYHEGDAILREAPPDFFWTFLASSERALQLGDPVLDGVPFMKHRFRGWRGVDFSPDRI